MVKSGIDEVLQGFFEFWFDYRICSSGKKIGVEAGMRRHLTHTHRIFYH